MSRQQRVLLSVIQRGLRPPRVDQEEYVRRVLFGGGVENGEEESERGETVASTQLRGFLVACIVPALTIVPYGEYEGWPLRAREDVLRAVESFAFVSEDGNGSTGKPKMTRAQMLGLVSFLYRMPRVYLEEEGKGYGSERSVHGLRWFMSEMAPFFSEHVLWVLANKVRVSLSNEEKEEEFSEADERDAVQSAVTSRSIMSYLVPHVEHASFFAMGEEKVRDQVKRALLGLVVPVIAVLPPLKWVVGVSPDVFDVARAGKFEMGEMLVPRLPSVGVELAHVQYATWVIMEMLDDDERLQLLSCLAGVEVYGKGFSRSMGERFRMHVATGALTALGTVF